MSNMKKIIIISIFIVSILVFFTSCNTSAFLNLENPFGEIGNIWNSSQGEYYEGVLNIGYYNLKDAEKLTDKVGASIQEIVPQIKVLSITFEGKVMDMKDAIMNELNKNLKLRENIRFIEPSFKRELIETFTNDEEKMQSRDIPNLEEFNWGSKMVKAHQAWKMGYTGQGVVVAVIDTGVDMSHPDLINQCIGGYAPYSHTLLAPATDNSQGVETHGTHVTGTIVSENNGFGITGIAYNSRVMNIRIFDDDSPTSYVGDIYTAAGLVWAVDNGAEVTNNSWGGKGYSNTLLEAFNYGLKHGVVHVVSMGNDHVDQLLHPSAYPGIINVGACNATKGMTYFSSRGQWLTVAAPGDYTILSTIPLWDLDGYTFEQPYAFYGGTSMAAPHVTGVTALLIEKLKTSTPSGTRPIPYTAFTIRKMLIEGAEDIMAAGFDEDSGWGLVQADASLNVDTSSIGNGSNLIVTSFASGTTTPSSPVYVTVKPVGFTAPDYYGKTNELGLLEFLELDPGVYDLYFGFVEGLSPFQQFGFMMDDILLSPGNNDILIEVDIP